MNQGVHPRFKYGRMFVNDGPLQYDFRGRSSSRYRHQPAFDSSRYVNVSAAASVHSASVDEDLSGIRQAAFFLFITVKKYVIWYIVGHILEDRKNKRTSGCTCCAFRLLEKFRKNNLE